MQMRRQANDVRQISVVKAISVSVNDIYTHLLFSERFPNPDANINWQDTEKDQRSSLIFTDKQHKFLEI
jgi:hypothetical protein